MKYRENTVYLEHHDELLNMHRFYLMIVTATVFDEWVLVREWGRVGSPGTVRHDIFPSEQDANNARQKISLTKQKKGYGLVRY